MKTTLIIFSFLSGLFNFSSSRIETMSQPTEPDVKVTEAISRPTPPSPDIIANANEWNRVPILEYHNIGPIEARWTRTYENFKKDLLWLYNNDYVLLSIEDFARDYYPIPAGKKPVALTFDDGKNSHFWYEEDGSIKKETAIGILDEFYETYPEFGRAAVFYVNSNPFGQPDLIQKKLEYLQNTGRQIGYHTLAHTTLSSMNAKVALGLLQQQKKVLDELKPVAMNFTTLAYPHGAVPSGNLNDMSPLISLGLLVGADPAYPLYHSRGNAYRTPRIQAIDDEWLRHFGRKNNTTDKQATSENFKVFISDGNPEVRTPFEQP